MIYGLNRKVELILAGFLSRVIAGRPLVDDVGAVQPGITPCIVKSRLYKKITRSLSEGQALSEVLGEIKGVPPLVVELIKRGEGAGDLRTALEAALAHYRTANRFGYHINRITGYSMTILGMLLLCYWIFYTLIAPAYESMYAMLGARFQLGPWGIFNNSIWMSVLIIGLIGLVVWARTVRHTSLAGVLASFLPVLKRAFRRLISLEILSSYSGMLAAGMDSATALQESAASVSDYSYGKAVQRAAGRVSEGMNITEALQSEELLKGLEATRAISLYDSTGGDAPVIDDTLKLLDEYLRLTLDRDMKLVLISVVSVFGVAVAVTIVSMFQVAIGLYDYI